MVHSNMGSKMTPSVISEGKEYPLAATESDMPWEVGFKHFSKKFQGCVKSISRVFQKSYKGVLRMFWMRRKFPWCFMEVSRVFQKNFKGIPRKLSENCKGVSKKLQDL